MKKRKKASTKHAQVSSFIIIAIVIVILGGILIFLNSESNSFNIGAERVDPAVQPIQTYVQNCLGEIGENGIEYTSLRGGYYKVPNPKTELDVPHYIKDGQGYVPTIEKIEEEISDYIKEKLETCTDYSSFGDFQINSGDLRVQTNIIEGKVSFEADYNLEITKAERNYQLRRFEAELPVRVKTVHETAENIVLNELPFIEAICIACIDVLVTEKDLKITSINYDDNTLIYSIIDENSEINDINFQYNFAIEYDFPDDL